MSQDVSLVERASCTKLMRATIAEHFPYAARILGDRSFYPGSVSVLDFVVWSYEAYVLRADKLTDDVSALRDQLKALDANSGRKSPFIDPFDQLDAQAVETPATARVATALGLPIADVQRWIKMYLDMSEAERRAWLVWSEAVRQLIVGVPDYKIAQVFRL